MQLPLHQNSQTKGKFIIIIQFIKIQDQSKTKEAIMFTKCDEGSKSRIQAKEYKIKFYTLFRFLFIMSVKFEWICK